MITFSLNAFIKLCLLDTGDQITEIQKRLNNSSGYDYYRTLNKAVRSYSGNRDANIEVTLNSPRNSVERDRNKKAFNIFKNKFGSSRNLYALDQRKNLRFSQAGISISVDPLFEITKQDVRQMYCLWPTKAPQLTQKYGAVACHVMRRANSTGKLSNGIFHFTDLTSNRIYSEKQITNNTNLILMADVNSIGTLVKQLS